MTYTTTPTTTQATPQPAGLYAQPSSLGDRQTSHGQQPLAFPLKHTDVKATISGNISRVEVTQTFENPFTMPLEATYVFPLPDEAAVDTMTIRLGDRTIQGRIEKREEAQAIYEQAKQEGRTAGLLEQERANIFTQSLANIRPGEQIEVVITYSDSLPYKQGNYEFVFPMVVGPRYIPGHPIDDTGLDHGSAPTPMSMNQDTDQVTDASHLNGPILPAGTRSGHDIQVMVEIIMGAGQGEDSHPGIVVSNLHSPSHQIRVETLDGLTRITLAPNDTIPNKDLIVRYQVAGANTQTSVLTQADERGGHFAMYLVPAIAYDPQQYIPKDMVFLIDTSGSQSGPPLAQCQALMRRFIEGLHPQDTFNIVNFANTTQQLSQIPLSNTPNNRQRALSYVNSLRAGGGTEMLRGLKTVLNLPQGLPQGLPQPFSQRVGDRIRNIVLLTDGYIGNETQIFAEVQRSLSPSTRLHSFGAGSSVNRFLLNRVAEFGRGISHVVRHDEPIDQVVDRFFGQINNPVLGNLSLRWDGDGVAPELYPMAPPDLFAEEPLVLFGRKGDRCSGTLHLSGMAGNGMPFEQSFAINFDGEGNPAIAQLWGRARIKELMNQMVSGETTQGVEAVTQTALQYQLLCQYTAFVAVSDEVRVEQPNEELSIHVPVNMPDGVSYEGVFGALASPSGMTSSASIASPPMVSAALPMASPSPKLARRSRTKARSSTPSGQSPSLASRLGGLFKKKAKSSTEATPNLPPSPAPRQADDKTIEPPSSPARASNFSLEQGALGQLNEDITIPSDPKPVPIPEPDSEIVSEDEFNSDLFIEPPYDQIERDEIEGDEIGYADDESMDDCETKLEDQDGAIHETTHTIEIIEGQGLQEDGHRLLEQHLQSVPLTEAQAGLLVFDLVIKQGRVKRVMLDIEASEAQDSEVIYQLRQALLTWSFTQLSLTDLRLKLRITT